METSHEDAEIAPADREQGQVIQEVETYSSAASEALRSLVQCHAKISQHLAPAGRRHVMAENEQRGLALMEMELSDIIASLKLNPLKLHHVYLTMWLDQLVRCSNELLDTYKIDPSRRRRLLPRALAYCRRRSQDTRDYWELMIRFLCITGRPDRWYMHLLPASTTTTLPPQASEQPVFGMDRSMKKLLRWLTPTAESNRLSVMAVVGPVGIGKTTLAIELHNRLSKYQTAGGGPYCFHYNIMVKIMSGEPDRIELVLQDILSKISDLATPTTLSSLKDLVHKQLQDKRYFICIDDVREPSDWSEIKEVFPENGLGSRILITTRFVSTEWAHFFSPDVHVHKMKPLNQVDSESLLVTTVFGSLECGSPEKIKPFIGEILMRCEGIPLFINRMAHWLKEKFQLQRQQHEDGAEKEVDIHHEELMMSQLPEQLKQALSSAYEGLSDGNLKILSLFMSVFPYGHKLEKDRLITRWHANMFGYPMLLMQFGDATKLIEGYLRELVNVNVITSATPTCKSDLDEADANQWHVNHFMHHFLVSKSADMGFAFTSDTLHCLATGHGGPLRLALHNPDPRIPSLLEKLDLLQTHSLTVSGRVRGIPLDKFVNLLVLDLEGWENLTDRDLQQVCRSKMIFLTYLNIRNTRVTELPQEIKDLPRLRVLDVSYTQISELPLEVFELEILKILNLRGTQIRQLPKEITRLKQSLSVLLLGDEGTTKSVDTATRVPHDVQHLYNLETLATIDLSEQPASFVNVLGDLAILRVLAITWSFHQCTDQKYREALLSCIQKWEWLRSLTIHCGLGCSMEFLGHLSHPPKILEKFMVRAGRFASIPKWISMLEYLSFVQITICKQGTEGLNILGGLPKLECLILGLDFIPEKAIVIGSDGFTELERFSVDCPMQWLAFSAGAMPMLRYLQLKFCSVPARPCAVPWGLENLRRLSEVALCYSVRCANSPSVEMTVEAVKKQVVMHPNPIDLFINGTEDDVQVAAFEEEVERAVAATQSVIDAEINGDDSSG